MWYVLLILACGNANKESLEEQPENDDSLAETDSLDESETETSTEVDEEVAVESLAGSIVWQVDFDATAEALGKTDCSYQRDYLGIEDHSAKWLCPECEKIFRVAVDMSAGFEDCYQQIASQPAEYELLGWSADGRFFRTSYGSNYILREQGSMTREADQIISSNSSEMELDQDDPEQGSLVFDIQGDFTVSPTVGDPMHGIESPDSYKCGWPKADPPAYTGNYSVSIGDTFPDGIFYDQCEEGFRLHDLKGHFLIIDISAVNCGPCRSMAAGEPDFAATMKAEGYDVQMITLLAPSLSEVLTPADTAVLTQWVTDFSLDSPVLQDRGFGYWLGQEAMGDEFGYPTWFLVAPDLTILEVNTGFGGWDSVAESIRNYE